MENSKKLSYVKALIYVATADDKIELSEKVYIDQIASAHGLNENEKQELFASVLSKKETMEEILSDITDRKTKLVLLYDLIAICYADEDYTDNENIVLSHVCEILHVESSKLDEIKNVMLKFKELQKQISVVLER